LINLLGKFGAIFSLQFRISYSVLEIYSSLLLVFHRGWKVVADEWFAATTGDSSECAYLMFYMVIITALLSLIS
jgi:hypothetical protein